MAGNLTDNGSDNFSWSSDDEVEKEKEVFDTGSSLTTLPSFNGTAEIIVGK